MASLTIVDTPEGLALSVQQSACWWGGADDWPQADDGREWLGLEGRGSGLYRPVAVNWRRAP